MTSLKEQSIDLRKKGFTLNEIVQKTGRSKTSIYFHIRNIPLNTRRLNQIREDKRNRARELASRRRGISERKFKKFSTWNKTAVFVTSHLIFDGEIKKIGCIYNNRSLALIERFQIEMFKLYKYAPRLYQDKKTGVIKVAYFNVALSQFMKEKKNQLLNSIENMDRDLQIEFLKSFFDDEGCIDFKPIKKVRRIRGYQKDVEILNLIQKMLRGLEIQSKVVVPNEVVITRKENLERFQKEINFSPGVYMNGKRSNSVWKKDMEKRKILDMALASFQK